MEPPLNTALPPVAHFTAPVPTPVVPSRRVCVAPMMDWTDRHCRYFHRQLTRHTWLYTEMVTTGALLHGDVPRHLDFNIEEHPVALQLGGSEPSDLAKSARLGEQWGYDEINLNCGCPSERVQKGAFGACLMAEPALVADCVKAMRDAVSIDITVKHRIGIDQCNGYEFMRDFVGTVADAGCRTFIVHARNAILKGLSPKENRDIPPLKYDFVYRLKRDFPNYEIILNGGVKTLADIDGHLHHVDGVMLGREAYHNPYLMSEFDARYYLDETSVPSREAIIVRMMSYIEANTSPAIRPMTGLRLNSITRHLLGLMAGLPHSKAFRQVLSDSTQLSLGDPTLLQRALDRMHQRSAS